jgi:PAS domain-containing protein
VVWTINPDGAATYFNRAWFDLVGGKLEDWTGTQWFSVIHPEDLPDVKAKWVTAKATQSPFMGIRRVLARTAAPTPCPTAHRPCWTSRARWPSGWA